MNSDEIEYMDKEEKELIESIEGSDKELKPSSETMKKKIEHAAREHRKVNETKMNIRLGKDELERIKKRASREGLKYQTFVKSVLHKYITGQLMDR